MTSFHGLPDLACRAVGGSVVAANDELFAPRESLIRPQPPVALPGFGPKGKVYDGWETRRRREPGVDWAVVRLGVPGVVHGVVVDTRHFLGNAPPEVSVEAVHDLGHPAAEDLPGLDWVTLVARTPAAPGTPNAYTVTDDRPWTHVRLSLHPDGGVARLRVHGVPVPDPRFLAGTVDLAALENGGMVLGCSDEFYGSAQRLIWPGPARDMGEGWENARRRGGGHDWVLVRLAGAGVVRHVELDTSCFVGNAPGEMRLAGCLAAGADLPGPGDPAWFDLVPHQPARPDTRHRVLVDSDRPVTHVRLDVYPDGGLARLRVWGELLSPPGA